MSRLHPAWSVAIVTALALLAASTFRSTTGVLMEPIHATFGWPMESISGAASLNLVLYGLATPFTAALMQTWGVRRTVVVSMAIVALASAATIAMTSLWQLWLLWGVLIGLGTGALALTFGTIIANRWFVAHRNLVTGIFFAAMAAGQVLFVPLIAAIAAGPGWRTAALAVAGCAVLAALACLLWLRDAPADIGAAPLSASPLVTAPTESDIPGASPALAASALPVERPLHAAVRVLREGSTRWSFWVLALTFFVCGCGFRDRVRLGLCERHDRRRGRGERRGRPARRARHLRVVVDHHRRAVRAGRGAAADPARAPRGRSSPGRRLLVTISRPRGDGITDRSRRPGRSRWSTAPGRRSPSASRWSGSDSGPARR